jgi:hypothetical protein
MPSEPTESTVQDQKPWQFRPGQSGNPTGRPPGSRHAALVALDAIGTEGGEDVLRSVVEAAKGGDMRAAEILLRRLWPERKGRPVLLDLPRVQTAGDVSAALAAVTDAVAAGSLSPEEGAAFAGILEAQRRAVETEDLQRRIAALEERAVRPQGILTMPKSEDD